MMDDNYIYKVLGVYLKVLIDKLNTSKTSYQVLTTPKQELSVDKLPIWAESLINMTHYSNFGPNFSVLQVIVCEDTYAEYKRYVASIPA